MINRLQAMGNLAKLTGGAEFFPLFIPFPHYPMPFAGPGAIIP